MNILEIIQVLLKVSKHFILNDFQALCFVITNDIILKLQYKLANNLHIFSKSNYSKIKKIECKALILTDTISIRFQSVQHTNVSSLFWSTSVVTEMLHLNYHFIHVTEWWDRTDACLKSVLRLSVDKVQV